MHQKPTLTYGSQFALLLGLAGVFMVIGALAILLIGSQVMHVSLQQFSDSILQPQNAGLARWLNTAAAFVSLFLPALIVARIVSKRPFAHLGFNGTMTMKQVALVVVLTFTAIVLSGSLGQLNEWIPLPTDWYMAARRMEDKYRDAMLTMATMKNAGDYIVALLVVAAAPAIFEETLFRGGLQPVITGWTRSRWGGIFITSVLFSAIHFSYFGFLPRLALGAVLGLIFSYSKNIWLNILLHFLNNALVVTQLYVMGRQGKPVEKTVDENMPMWWGLIALALLLALLRAFRKESRRVLAAKETAVHQSHENIVS